MACYRGLNIIYYISMLLLYKYLILLFIAFPLLGLKGHILNSRTLYSYRENYNGLAFPLHFCGVVKSEFSIVDVDPFLYLI